MARILVLTNNVLSEMKLQAQLQQLNYEVLVSSSFLQQLIYQMPIQKEIRTFNLAIFSEKITDLEVEKVFPMLVEENIPMIQIVENPKELLNNQLENQVVKVESDISAKALREQIETILQGSGKEQPSFSAHRSYDFPQERVKKIPLLQQAMFTQVELRILESLYKANGKLVTKEELSESVWQSDVTKSRETQIYTYIGRLNDKLRRIYPNDKLINAQRGRGYYLSEDFYSIFVL